MPNLRDLGLSEYESRVYRALLRSGPTTAKELSGASGVPMGRIYDVLAGLETRELVRSQQPSRPAKYAAVDPETALPRLLDDRRREMEDELAQFEEVVEDLSERLVSNEPADGQFYTVAIGPDDTMELLFERLAAATDRIDMVVGDVSPQFDVREVSDRVASQIEAALERDVSISLLVPPEVVDASSATTRRRYQEIVAHPNYAVRTTDGLTGTFNLMDRTEVCIEFTNPLQPESSLALIALRDPTFARNLSDAFEQRWNDADPIQMQGT